jgi:hypothetical protein
MKNGESEALPRDSPKALTAYAALSLLSPAHYQTAGVERRLISSKSRATAHVSSA